MGRIYRIKYQHTSEFGEFLRVRSQTDRHRGEGNFYKRNQIYRCGEVPNNPPRKSI
ncbi:hypothetical protein T12_11411 [Trichinella patagoniensis]|uniref:Uncharacterized protein n=1 Tax=Trichinella patagoniensis TaxID=990121 RepID=A0A0V0YP56_9BILA|nr:hypothetical protein T12_11411 [Trichinella patagoniensis]